MTTGPAIAPGLLGRPTVLAQVAPDAWVEHIVEGAGPVAIVLVNGSGGPLAGWHRVWMPLAERTRVFAYNRPGVGKSSVPAKPQHGTALVAGLRAALQAAGVAPPWLLVGHSFGGLIAQLHARHHPDEVAGVVLLEATAPGDVAAFAEAEGWLQRAGRRVLERLSPLPAWSEVRHAAATVQAVRDAPPFPALPLTVVTGGRPAMAWATPAAALATRAENQRALVGLSPRGRQVLATRSGHFPQFSEPALVVAEVLRTLEAATPPGRAPAA